ncbi:JAB domain-containing protein [Azospirillum doebereinerae]
MLEDGWPPLGAPFPAAPETRVERGPDSGRRRPPAEPEGHGRRGLDARGFDSIPDVELLAHLLALVARDADPDAAAGRLLQRWGDLTGVATAAGPELRKLVAFQDHTGPLVLRLLWEMAARLAREEMVREPVLISSAGLVTYCTVRLARERADQVRLLYLDGAQRLIADERHQSGTIGAVELYPREILRRAVELDALGIVVARGQAGRPARLTIRDRDDAGTLEAAGEVLGLRLVDYLVIGRTGHASYRAGERAATPGAAGSGRRSRP